MRRVSFFPVLLLILNVILKKELTVAFFIEVGAETGNRTFGREWRVKQLLDRSLQYVQTSSHGAYMAISRHQSSNWQLSCEAQLANFTCHVQLGRMRITFYTLVGVRYVDIFTMLRNL